QRPRAGGPGSITGQLIEGDNLIHIPDAADTDAYRAGDPTRRAMVDLNGGRTLLAVALRKSEQLLGYITVYRREVRPFTEKQIALLQNFAAQAVIAMENARLITETREALDQQTATAEILQVINSSPGDLAPVFDAMLEKALRLCDAAFGVMRTWGDGEYSPPVAVRGAPPELAEVWRTPIAPTPNSAAERIAQGETCVVVPNLLEDPMYLGGAPGLRALVELGGARSYAVVALRKEDVLLGIIAIYRQEVRPFTDKQIALLQNFAAQADRKSTRLNSSH